MIPIAVPVKEERETLRERTDRTTAAESETAAYVLGLIDQAIDFATKEKCYKIIVFRSYWEIDEQRTRDNGDIFYIKVPTHWVYAVKAKDKVFMDAARRKPTPTKYEIRGIERVVLDAVSQKFQDDPSVRFETTYWCCCMECEGSEIVIRWD